MKQTYSLFFMFIHAINNTIYRLTIFVRCIPNSYK